MGAWLDEFKGNVSEQRASETYVGIALVLQSTAWAPAGGPRHSAASRHAAADLSPGGAQLFLRSETGVKIKLKQDLCLLTPGLSQTCWEGGSDTG